MYTVNSFRIMWCASTKNANAMLKTHPLQPLPNHKSSVTNRFLHMQVVLAIQSCLVMQTNCSDQTGLQHGQSFPCPLSPIAFDSISRRMMRCMCSATEQNLVDIIQHQERPNDDSGQLQDGDLVPRRCHAAKPSRGAFELVGHGGERIGL